MPVLRPVACQRPRKKARRTKAHRPIVCNRKKDHDTKREEGLNSLASGVEQIEQPATGD
jgi:hypothetical protein